MFVTAHKESFICIHLPLKIKSDLSPLLLLPVLLISYFPLDFIRAHPPFLPHMAFTTFQFLRYHKHSFSTAAPDRCVSPCSASHSMLRLHASAWTDSHSSSRCYRITCFSSGLITAKSLSQGKEPVAGLQQLHANHI